MADQELILRIRADMADVQRKLRRLERDGGDSADGIARRFERAGRRISSAFRAIRGPALAVGAAAGGIAVLAQRSLAAAENIQDLADRAGVSAEFLQELRFATNQSGASARDFDDAISRLNRRFSLFNQFLSGNATEAGPAAAAFRSLGLESRIASGELQNAEQVFYAAVQAVNELEDTTGDAALASQLFGEDAGPRLQGLLRRGIDGIRDMAAEARELGIVMSDELVANGARASDQLEILGTVMQSRVTAAVVENAEEIDELVQAFTEALPGMIELATNLASAFVSVGEAIQGATRAFLGMEGAGRSAMDPTETLIRSLSEAPGGFVTPNLIEQLARDAGFNRIAAESFANNLPASSFRTGRSVMGAGGDAGTRRLTDEAVELFINSLRVQLANRRNQIALGNLRSPSVESGPDDSANAIGGRDDKTPTPGLSVVSTGLKKFQEQAQEAGEEIAKAAGDGLPAEFERNRDQISNSIQNGLRAAFDGNLLDFIKNNLQNAAFEGLANAITSAFASEKGTGLFGSIIGGLFGGGFGGPGKATGGPASGLTLVGEQGPELVALGGMANVMTANMTRMAMSASKMTRSGGMTNVSTSLNIDARGAEVGVEERIRAVLSIEGPRLQRQAVEATISALNRSQRNTQVA